MMIFCQRFISYQQRFYQFQINISLKINQKLNHLYLPYCYKLILLKSNRQNMNLSKTSKHQNNNNIELRNSQSDFQKLMDICNSYGLSQQQTNQLIDQFKKGALFSPNKSIDDSLNDSFGDLTFSQRQEQQYSFKNRKQQIEPKTFQKYKAKQSQIKIEQSCHQQSRQSDKQQNQIHDCQSLERLMMEKRSVQKHLIGSLQQQNQSLRKSLCQKQNQISNFISMKNEDTQIIKGLKDIIANLTTSIQQKDVSFREIHDKYTSLMESKLREMAFRHTTEINESNNTLKEHTNLATSFSRTNSTNKFKNIATLSESREHEVKANKTLAESRQQQIKLNNNKADGLYNQMKKNRTNSKVDVKKYKEMIQNLRNNY